MTSDAHDDALRVQPASAVAAPDVDSYHDWLGLKCAHTYSLTDRFFGRATEFEQLERWMSSTGSEPSIQCLVALGGTGKSALAWHWISQAAFRRAGYRGVFWCSFYQKDFGFLEFLRSALEWCGRLPTRDVEAMTRTEVERQLLEVMTKEPFVFVLDGLERLMNGYANLFDRAVDPDSVHQDIDAADVSRNGRRLTDPRNGVFLRRLADNLRSRILITSRLRPADLERSDTSDFVERVGFVPLSGFSPDEVGQLWHSILPDTPLTTEAELVIALCEQHPLIISILARSVASGDGDWDHWRGEPRHHDFAPPADVSAAEARAHVIGVCIRDLDERSYDVLGALATSGKPMTLDLISKLLLQGTAMSGDERWTSKTRVIEEIDRLVSLGFVGKTTADPVEFDVHPVVRGAVWNLLTDTRGERHLRYALSEFYATPDPTDNGSADLNKGISLYRLLVQSNELDRAWEMLINKLWWPLNSANDPRTLKDLLELLLPNRDAMQLVPLTSRREQGNACAALGDLLMQAGDGDRSDRLLRWAGAIRLQVGDFAGFLGARQSRTWQTLYEGRLFDAEYELRQMRVQAEHFDGGEDILPFVETWIGIVLALRGLKAEASSQFRLSEARTSERRWWAQGVAEGCVYLEDPDKALRVLEDGSSEPLLPFDTRSQESWELLTRGMASYQKGEYDSAEEDLVKAREYAIRMNYAIIQCFAIPYLAAIALDHRNDVQQADMLLEDYDRVDPQSRYRLAATDRWCVQARCSLRRGDRDGAAQHAARAYRLAACDGPPFVYDAGLRRSFETLGNAGAYVPATDARLDPFWNEKLADLSDRAQRSRREASEEETRPSQQISVAQARKLLPQLAVLKEASDRDRQWWTEVTEHTDIAVQFPLANEMEQRGLTLRQFREAYEQSAHKSVLLVFSQLHADSLIRPQTPRPVRTLGDDEKQAWLAERELHKQSLDLFLRQSDYGLKMLRTFQVHELDIAGISAFLLDCKRRIGFDPAGFGTAWWTQVERECGATLPLLVLAECVFWSGATLETFVGEIASNSPRGIEYAFLSIRLQQAIADLEVTAVTKTEGWSDLQIFLRLKDVKERLGWSSARAEARAFWTDFEKRNERKIARVLQIAEELAIRKSTIDEYHQAYLSSHTPSIEANLAYVDYFRLKEQPWNGDAAALDAVARSASLRTTASLVFSNTAEWPDERVRARLDALKTKLGSEVSYDDEDSWWLQLETNLPPRALLRIAEELEARGSSLRRLYKAHIDGKTESLPAALAWLDFAILKDEDLERRRQRAKQHALQAADHLAGGRVREAIDGYTAALREDPATDDYYVQLARSSAAIDAEREAAIRSAIDVLQRGLTACSNPPVLVAAVADLHAALGADGERQAFDVVEQGIRKYPDGEPLYVKLASLWEQAPGLTPAVARRHALLALRRGIAHCPALLKTVRRRTYERCDTSAPETEPFMYVPVVTPVVLEVSDVLVPFVDSSQDGGAFLHKAIPEMRDRIQEAFAVRLPGVRLRSNPALAPGAFVVQVDEIPVLHSSVALGMRYVPAGTHVTAATATATTEDPLTGETCQMIAEDTAGSLLPEGSTSWTVPQFLLRHLERVLTCHHYRFVDQQSVDSFLAPEEVVTIDGVIKTVPRTWAKDRPDLVERKLRSPDDRFVFTRLLRALIRDGVRIPPLPALLDALPDSGLPLEQISEMLASLRVAFKDNLPGNQPGIEHVRLGAAVEEEWRERKPSRREEQVRLLTIVREHVALAAPGRRALVVSHSSMRPWLQRLVDFTVPDLTVMTDAEVSERAGAASV